jgi:glucose/arabinose dehydrogenase
LLSLPPSASGAPDADIVVASPSAHAWLSADAPTLLASVGSGASAIEVRAVSAGGAAAYQAALRSDLADRRSAGTQLLHSRRLEVSAQGAGQLATGEVDTRLMVTLAVLASQHPWRVAAFGDGSPGVPLTEAPYRQVIIAAAGGGGRTAGLAAALTFLRAQQGLYQPAQVTTVRLADGQPGLRIDFAAPSPLGLLAGSTPG